jgi:RNA polymerase sigma-70 factor (ECF subfamily)
MMQKRNATDRSVRINNEESSFVHPVNGTPLAQLSDEILVAQVARGESAALEILYERYASTVLGISLKIIGDQAGAEDVLQETFWRVWRYAATFQTQLGSFTSWLFKITRNMSIDMVRKRSTRPSPLEPFDGDPELDQIPDPAANVPEQAQASLTRQQVRKALATLPLMQKQVIEMAYFCGMTRQEIAKATGESLGTVHTRARLGLRKLRLELEKQEFKG